MPVLMWIVIVAVVAGAVLVARGRGGELSVERGDYREVQLGPVSATDIALLRPPMALWGYNMQATDDALDLIAASIRDRDIRIVALEQLVTDLSREPAVQPLSSPYQTARHRRASFDPASFDPASFDPASFDPAPFDPAPPPEQSHD